jgi:hypothetical protein
VEPQFTKRSDAKSAVALLAISQNVGGWIYDRTMTIARALRAILTVKSVSFT